MMSGRECGTCPVVEAIREIKGSADYQEMSSENCVELFRAKYIINEVSFYATMRKLEVARFKLGNPGPADIERKRAAFRTTLGEIYEKTINTNLLELGLVLLQEQLVTFMEYVIVLLANIPSASAANLSIPFFSSIAVAPGELKTPEEWRVKLMSVMKLLTKINLSSLLGREPDLEINLHSPPEYGDVHETNEGRTLDEMLAREHELIKKAARVEKYYFHILEQLGRIVKFVDEYIGTLDAEIEKCQTEKCKLQHVLRDEDAY